MACFRGNREEFYGEVLLLDERKITLKKSSKAAAILQQVFSHLDLVEVKFFGLRFCDNKQQTHWLDPSKTLSQHRELAGPPYIFYFGVRFYAEDPSELKDETTRWQFYLQLRQDVRRGRLLCPAHLRPQLFALMLQVDRGDHDVEEKLDDPDVETIYKSLSGVSRPQAQSLFLSLCSSLQLYGASLFNAYGENQSEYFLGPTPVGVVVYKNKVLVGKYFWQRIAKLHYKDETFELTVVGKNGSETSFYFQTSDRCDCKRLWRCCVDHHIFFRMSDSKPVTYKVQHNSARSPTLAPRLKSRLSLRLKLHANHTTHEGVSSQPVMMTQAAPPAVQSCRSERTTNDEDQEKPSAPWENSGHVGGLFNSKFPPNVKEEKQDGERPQRRSRSLDGDRPMRKHRRRSGSRGNTSSGSESEKSNNGRRRRRTKRQWSHENLIWQHIQKQLVEPDGLTDRQKEEIRYTEVRVSGEPIRAHHRPRGRQHRRCASASDVNLKVELLPPLPVTMATSSSHQAPTSP